jgi:hypothetical protein
VSQFSNRILIIISTMIVLLKHLSTNYFTLRKFVHKTVGEIKEMIENVNGQLSVSSASFPFLHCYTRCKYDMGTSLRN